MSIGALDTNSSALATRLALQHRLSDFNLNAWIFSHIDVRPGQRWLDLGCGRGEQSLPLAEKLGDEGRVTSVDLSEDSLAEVRRQAEAKGLVDRIAIVHSDLDRIAETVPMGGYDRAVGSYSLYYATDTDALFGTVARLLADDGQIFFCGPAFDNNLELRQATADASGDESPLRAGRPATFMEEEAPAACRKYFTEVEIFRFDNPVTFDRADDLVAYWRSHNLFREAADDRFCALAEARIGADGAFMNKKRGIGILAKAPRRTRDSS